MAGKKSPARVVLCDNFFDDKRFKLLAAYCDEDEDRVKMRVIDVWRHCFLNKSDVMESAEIDRIAKWTNRAIGFGVLLSRSELAEVTAAIGVYRIKGIKDRSVKSIAPKPAPSTDLGANTSRFIANYCIAFQERWHTKPPLLGKDIGAIQRIVKSIGIERALTLLETFMKMQDQRFINNRHSISTMEFNLNAIAVKADTGQAVTQSQARTIERREELASWVEGYGDPR